MESYWKVVSIPDVELVVGCVASGVGLIFRFSHSSKYTRAVRIRNPKPRYSPQRTSVHHHTRNLCVTVHLCSNSSPKCAAVHLNRSILQQVDSRLFILRILFPKRRQYTSSQDGHELWCHHDQIHFVRVQLGVRGEYMA